MKKNSGFSRRAALGAIGAGTAGLAITRASTARPAGVSSTPQDVARSGANPGANPSISGGKSETVPLLRPLVPGARLGDATLVAARAQHGALHVVMADADGGRFQVDICRIDPAGKERGIQQTERFDFYLANEGGGQTTTAEAHGLALMALAELVRANEQHVDVSAFVPRSERQLAQGKMHLPELKP